MQNRQQIREQFGILEEQLEELGSLARSPERAGNVGTDILLQDALEAVRELSRLVHEQQLLKSVPAHDFLLRICGLLAQDASAQGIEIAVSHYGEGRISMEMAELVLGAIVAGFRVSLRSLKGATRPVRLKHHLFPTSSIYLEVRATASEIQFRLLDDGRGFGRDSGADRSFGKLRDHIARCGGWFGRKTFDPCGGMIEFKVPLTHNRTQAFVLRQGRFEVLIPTVCVAEVATPDKRPADDAITYHLHETEGLTEGGEGSATYVRVGVADLQFWLGCDSISGPQLIRRAKADEFFEEGSWLRSLGLFHEDGTGRALPLLDGQALVQLSGQGSDRDRVRAGEEA